MTATQEKPKPAPKPKDPMLDFVMPKPYVGEWVLHKMHADSPWCPALVTQVGERGIHLNVHHKDTLAAIRCFGGCMHETDPLHQKRMLNEGGDPNGCWKFTYIGDALRSNGILKSE